jgi:hypothetical protein
MYGPALCPSTVQCTYSTYLWSVYLSGIDDNLRILAECTFSLFTCSWILVLFNMQKKVKYAVKKDMFTKLKLLLF